MNEVLDRIERELVVGVRRRNAVMRRRRSLASLTVLGVLGLGAAGAGAGVYGPIDRFLSGSEEPGFARDTAGGRVDLRLTDAGGLEWTTTLYRARNKLLAQTAAAEGQTRVPGYGGTAGVLVASALRHNPILDARMITVRRSEHEHYLITGAASADARTVTISIDGHSRPARLSDGAVSVPVEVSEADLTERGKAQARTLPTSVAARAYAVALPPDALTGRDYVDATITTTLKNGSIHTYRTRGRQLCASRCATSISR